MEQFDQIVVDQIFAEQWDELAALVMETADPDWNRYWNQGRRIDIFIAFLLFCPESDLSPLLNQISYFELAQTIVKGRREIYRTIFSGLLNNYDEPNLMQAIKKAQDLFRDRFIELQLEREAWTKEIDPYPHQKETLVWMREREEMPIQGVCGGILALFMGLGKTLTVLLHILHSQHDRTPTLIVCPKSILAVWTGEIERFFPGRISFLLLHSEYTDVADITVEECMQYDVIITTYETVAKADVLQATEWSRIVADEAHRFNNPKTQIYKSMMALSAVNKWCLSGTPIRNYDTDIWALLTFCGLLNVDRKIWSDKLFEKLGLEATVKYLNYEEANIELPPMQEQTITLKMPARQRATYLTYIAQLAKAIALLNARRDKKEEEKKEEDINYATVLGLFTKLREFCIDPVLISNEGDSVKIQKCTEIVKSIIDRGEKVVIFSSFVKALERVEMQLDDLGIKWVQIDGSVASEERNTRIAQFRKKVDVILLTYKVGSEGLNLTAATNCIFLEPYWTPATENQALARIHRIGQKNPVTLYRLLMENTIETEMVEEIKKRKNQLMDEYRKSGIGIRQIERLIK